MEPTVLVLHPSLKGWKIQSPQNLEVAGVVGVTTSFSSPQYLVVAGVIGVPPWVSWEEDLAFSELEAALEGSLLAPSRRFLLLVLCTPSPSSRSSRLECFELWFELWVLCRRSSSPNPSSSRSSCLVSKATGPLAGLTGPCPSRSSRSSRSSCFRVLALFLRALTSARSCSKTAASFRGWAWMDSSLRRGEFSRLKLGLAKVALGEEGGRGDGSLSTSSAVLRITL
mmetsp:Transcript_96125/g.173427  ORF Transcript_96125/g.173427 Transcript_96125/m.173427 type:complete len:226 (-) Transcript_96125:307-984(-)